MLAQRSLKRRLLLVTLVTAGLTLVVSGFMLSALFRDHVRQQFVDRLTAELDQVMARLEADPQGLPRLDPTRLSDPRWSRPQSGLYWQVDGAGEAGEPALLRSRSLWDTQLTAPRDTPLDGELHIHDVLTQRDDPLLLIERRLNVEGASATWRVMVAAEWRPIERAIRRFDTTLATSWFVLLLLFTLGAWLQVRVGLAPLGRLRQALGDLRAGRTQRLTGQYPDEVQPLVDDLNGLLERNAAVLERARAQAGNLAHALRTPLTILAQGAANAQDGASASGAFQQLVAEQVQTARRHIDWHLARSRAAAATAAVGLATPLRPVVDGLVRVMQKVHADRALSVAVDVDDRVVFAGESQDLQEMLGNLLDNACKAARAHVRIGASQAGDQLRVTVDDDGPGIPAPQMAEALQRGARLDESLPGSGLGLAIVQDLATLYGGSVALGRSALGGLQAELRLPGA